MTSAVLAGLLARQPFRPFSFVLGDDYDIHVERRDQVRFEFPDMPGPIFIVTDADGWEHIIDLGLVARIDVQPEKES